MKPLLLATTLALCGCAILSGGCRSANTPRVQDSHGKNPHNEGYPGSAHDGVSAAEVHWSAHLGWCRSVTNTLFCLLSQGFLRVETTNVDTVVKSWIRDHPKAQLVSVFEMPYSSRDRSAKMAYVWVVQGQENMNVEMVREGCFVAETQFLLENDKPMVPVQQYDDFVRKVIAAGREAQNQKLGIWGGVSK